jgi:L-lysine 6-transaminase
VAELGTQSEQTATEGSSTSSGSADQVLELLGRHLLVDGYDFVLDLDASEGATLVDARTGSGYLDLFTFYASNALGMNHPALTTPAVQARLARAATHKPSNSDVYTPELAGFVDTFARVLGDPHLPHLFLIEGGGPAVENALKVAFDWKSRVNEAAGRDPSLGMQVMHLKGAFHGRTGYTLSLTNTDPAKVDRFPRFAWPRIPSPALRFPLAQHEQLNRDAEDAALRAARQAFEDAPNDIACVIAEPIQGEGGDHHLSSRFLLELQTLAHEHDALFVLDEVQTGVGLTGTPWCFQQLGLAPDAVAFGKKTHVCGVMAGGRVNEIEDHVFAVSSRINSTFGGGLVDMVRATVMLEVLERDELIPKAVELGAHLLGELHELASRHPAVSQVRGRGLMCALDLPDTDVRNQVSQRMFTDERVFLLGCGTHSLRFRPTLTVTEGELSAGVAALDRVLSSLRL